MLVFYATFSNISAISWWPITKPGANARRIGDMLVWAVRSNDLTHWTTQDFFFPFFVVCFCLITLCIIIYCLFLISGTLCIFCCNLNLNFWCFMSLSAIFHLYHGDQFLGVALVYTWLHCVLVVIYCWCLILFCIMLHSISVY